SRPVTIDNFSRRQFLKAGGIGVLGAFASRAQAWSNQDGHFILFVGTYTSGASEGIYGYYELPESGSLSRFHSCKSVNPSFLAIDPGKKFLYAVNEVSEYEGKPGGAVSAFALDHDTTKYSLRLLNQQPTLGADPCYVTVDSKRKNLLVANYTGGSVTVLPIRPDGSLGAATDVKQHEGSGPKEQQKGPHAHCIILDRAERYALVTDLGADKIMIYRYDGERGKLTPNKHPFVQLQAGAGPRHLTFDPTGKYLYAINELDSTLTSFKYDDDDGKLKHIETVSTLPSDFTGVSYCADVHIHGSGKFLYGSNRGHNSIVVFEINRGNGKLKLVEHVSTLGDWPRNFAIDPYSFTLLVANQRSNNVVSFHIDGLTGRLRRVIDVVEEIPSPVCLKFLWP
ncbi:MAG TPA: lactonase family protein, partial [Pyrinomonadaceae bacterium]|nr:lactonase family protein [Pyrinomonadaceae bacterium]